MIGLKHTKRFILITGILFVVILSSCSADGTINRKQFPSESSAKNEIETTDVDSLEIINNNESVNDSSVSKKEATDDKTIYKKDSLIDEKIKRMSLEEKVYQMFIVTPEMLTDYGLVTQAGPASKAAIEEKPVGGLIYFAQNLETVDQTREMLNAIQDYSLENNGIGLFLAVDEEGGTVARCADSLGTTAFKDMSYYGEMNDSETAYNIGYTIGSDLKSLGFNVDFAPVADVNLSQYSELGGRTFSSEPNIVANMIENEVKGFKDSGVASTLKHYPGLGAENGNAHYDDKIIIDRSLEQLESEEFVPFQKGIDAGSEFVMVSHQIITGIGDNLPAEFSYRAVTELLRGELGFKGITITDSQQMNTISGSYSAAEAAVMSVQAGMDIILMPDNLDQAVNGIIEAVNSGVITEERIDESVIRILTLKESMEIMK